VDIGKSLAVLSFAGAVLSIFDFVGMLFVGCIAINLLALVGIVLGIGLWRHRSWAHTLLLVIAWGSVIVATSIVFTVVYRGSDHVKLSMGRTVIDHPQPWQFCVFALMLAPLLWFFLGALHSEKARTEFKSEA